MGELGEAAREAIAAAAPEPPDGAEPTVAGAVELVAPLPAGGTLELMADRFLEDPRHDFLAIVDADGHPVALADRAALLRGEAYEHEPLLVRPATTLRALARRMAGRPSVDRVVPAVCCHCDGGYIGLVRVERVLGALGAESSRRTRTRADTQPEPDVGVPVDRLAVAALGVHEQRHAVVARDGADLPGQLVERLRILVEAGLVPVIGVGVVLAQGEGELVEEPLLGRVGVRAAQDDAARARVEVARHRQRDAHAPAGLAQALVPAAMGVRMAHPDPAARVTAFLGDGTFLMDPTELVTAAQEGLPITVVIPENHGFQVIHRLQMFRSGREFGNEFRYRTEPLELADATDVQTPPGWTATTCPSTLARSRPGSVRKRCAPTTPPSCGRPWPTPAVTGAPSSSSCRSSRTPTCPVRACGGTSPRPRSPRSDTVPPLRSEYEHDRATQRWLG